MTSRRWRGRALLVFATIAGAVAITAGPGLGSDPQVLFGADGAPTSVTAGRTAHLTFDVANQTRASLNRLTFRHTLPPGASLVSVTPSQGDCSQQDGTISCALGKLPRGASATVSVFLTAPQAGFEGCGTITWKQTGSSAWLTDTVCTSMAVRPADDPNFQGGCIDPETEISTGSGTTASDPQTTSLRTPDGACVTVGEVPATSPTDACGAGATCKTDVSEVEHPPCEPSSPCTITVTFDSSFGKITKLYYNGVLVQPCTTPGVASPDPCLVSRTLLPRSLARALPDRRDTQFVILSAIDAKLRGG
jgi:hypothetical protein